MFDVATPQSANLVGAALSANAQETAPMPKHFPILITKTENGFLTEVQYANAKRVYTDFDSLPEGFEDLFC